MGVQRSAMCAQKVVDDFVREHRSAAIPSLIAACVLWAVEHGGTDVMKGSLRNALDLADDLDAEVKRGAQ